MLKSQMFDDEFLSSLDYLDRYIWVGLILVCDDQGRILDNCALIRSKIFPMDDLPLERINDCISRLQEAGKITRYKTNEKPVIQIVNWWKHQKPTWAGESQFDPPPGWVDRVRFQKGFNEEKKTPDIEVINWDKPGGYLEVKEESNKEDYLEGLVKARDRNRDRNQVKGLVKGEDQEQGADSEAETEKQNVSETIPESRDPIFPSPSPSPSSSQKNKNLTKQQIISNEIESISKQLLHLNQNEIDDVTKNILLIGADVRHIHQAIKDLKDQNKKITMNSLLGFVKGSYLREIQLGRGS